MSRRRWLSSALVLVVGMGLVVAGDPIALAEPAASVAGVAIGGAGGDQPDGLSLTSVSNTHPNYVSGGQVLLRVTAPDRDGGSVLVTLNGRPVTADFRRQADGTLLGLVPGLRDRPERGGGGRRPGPDLADGRQPPDHRAGVLRPAADPVLLRDHRVRAGGGGAAAVLCAHGGQLPVQEHRRGVRRRWPTRRRGRPIWPPRRSAGRTVPYIVRVETGTIDRAVYQIAALYDGTDAIAVPRRHELERQARSTPSVAAATAGSTRARAPAAC